MPIKQQVSELFKEFDSAEDKEISLLKGLLNGFSDALNDEVVIKGCIQEYLQLRWARIKNTFLAYPIAPHHPVNQFCSKLAEIIAAQNEPIIKLLIPSLIERDYVAGNLETLTEMTVDGARRLIPNQPYFLLDNNTTILPLIDWFEYQNDPASPHYYHLYTQNNQWVPLTEPEKSLLQQSCGSYSESLFLQLEYYRELALATNTLYGSLKLLIKGLKKGGVSLESDPALRAHRARIAGQAANDAAEKFIAQLAKIPESPEKDTMLEMRSEVYSPIQVELFESEINFKKHHPSIREYLLIIRHSLGHVLTEDEMKLREEQDLFNCVEEISLGLEAIVKAHRRALENIHVDSFEDDHPAQQNFPFTFEEVKNQVITHLREASVQFAPQATSLNCSEELYHSLLEQLVSRRLSVRLNNLPDFMFLHEWLSENEFLSIVRAMNQETKDEFILQAMKQSVPKLIPVLIREGANFNQRIDYDNLMIIALRNDWNEVLEVMYEQDLSNLPEAWNENTFSPLQIALDRKNFTAFKKLLANMKKNFDEDFFNAALRTEDPYGDNLIAYILRTGSEEAVDHLVEQGLSVLFDEKNSLLKNSIHQAVHCGKPAMLKKLLSVTKPALLSEDNLYDQTPFESAVVSGKNAEAEILIAAHQANHLPVGELLNLAYTACIAKKQMQWLLRFLTLDTNNEILLNQVQNGLEPAMRYGQIALITKLIERGANLGAVTSQGSLLHFALKNNWDSVLRVLLKTSQETLKSLMNTRTAEKKSPLEVAHTDVDPDIRSALERYFKREADDIDINHSGKKHKI